MATILAHITIREGHETRFEACARQMFESTHAHESGVRQYQYWRGAEPRRYYTLLAFDDYRAFIAHQTSEHHEGAAAELRAVIEDIRLEWVDPIEGASPLPPTEHLAPAADASDLAKTYSESYRAQIAAWWQPAREAARQSGAT